VVDAKVPLENLQIFENGAPGIGPQAQRVLRLRMQTQQVV